MSDRSLICPGWAAPFAWNCMYAAFSALTRSAPRQIFTERLPTVVAPYARRTTRLTDVFTLIGFALGGEAGQRLVAGMGLSTSPDTLLRLIHTTRRTYSSTPRVLRVDDFSFWQAQNLRHHPHRSRNSESQLICCLIGKLKPSKSG